MIERVLGAIAQSRKAAIIVAAAFFVGSASCSVQNSPVDAEGKEQTETPQAAAAADLRGSRPNIVLIMADDLGYGELGVYGQAKIATPNIDRLAREGMTFVNLYAGGPVCAPSRGALMQGKHTGRIRNRGNNLRAAYLERGDKVRVGLKTDDLTVAETLSESGYSTALFGKWHLEDPLDPAQESWPHRKGFGESLVPIIDIGQNTFYPEYLYRNGVREIVPDNQNGKRTKYVDKLYTDEAIRFVESAGDRPFFLYVSFKTPHEPNEINELGEYAGETWPEIEKRHAARISEMDRQVGRLTAAIDDKGISEKTLIIFTSDNGPHGAGGLDVEFFDSNGFLRGKKGELFEGGIRVPAIFRWKGSIKAGASSTQRAAFWDFMPTFAELAGVDLDEEETDGVSLVDAMKGSPAAERDYLYWEYQNEDAAQAVIVGDWKLIRITPFDSEKTARTELYNLANDPREERDVSLQNAGIVDALERVMDRAHVPSKEYPFPSE